MLVLITVMSYMLITACATIVVGDPESPDSNFVYLGDTGSPREATEVQIESMRNEDYGQTYGLHYAGRGAFFRQELPPGLYRITHVIFSRRGIRFEESGPGLVFEVPETGVQFVAEYAMVFYQYDPDDYRYGRQVNLFGNRDSHFAVRRADDRLLFIDQIQHLLRNTGWAEVLQDYIDQYL